MLWVTSYEQITQVSNAAQLDLQTETKIWSFGDRLGPNAIVCLGTVLPSRIQIFRHSCLNSKELTQRWLNQQTLQRGLAKLDAFTVESSQDNAANAPSIASESRPWETPRKWKEHNEKSNFTSLTPAFVSRHSAAVSKAASILGGNPNTLTIPKSRNLDAPTSCTLPIHTTIQCICNGFATQLRLESMYYSLHRSLYM